MNQIVYELLKMSRSENYPLYICDAGLADAKGPCDLCQSKECRRRKVD